MKIKASVLRRFVDDNPQNRSEKSSHSYISVPDLYADIRSNLECLLNQRIQFQRVDAQHPQLSQSLVSYGIDDFSHYQLSSSQFQHALCDHVRQAIIHFEPRLCDVYVTALADETSKERTLYLKIEATIDLKPEPLAAVFESTVDRLTQKFMFSEN